VAAIASRGHVRTAGSPAGRSSPGSPAARQLDALADRGQAHVAGPQLLECGLDDEAGAVVGDARADPGVACLQQHVDVGATLAAASPPSPGGPDDLTDREVQVLRLLALGHTNAEIGQQLFLSMRTVEAHRSRMQQKLNRFSRAQLVRYALDRGLLTDEPGRAPPG
jgi:DNA-binding CsgD family transcriptional regulator